VSIKRKKFANGALLEQLRDGLIDLFSNLFDWGLVGMSRTVWTSFPALSV